MRKPRIFEHISLDGVIQSSADENDFPYGDWSGPYRTPAGRDLVLAMYGKGFDLLLGRRTYDGFSVFWPKAPSSPMSDALNAAKKYVVTHRPESLAWGPFEGLASDDAVRQSGMFHVLTPDQCVAYAHKCESAGHTMSVQPLLGGLSPEIGWRSLELFCTNVLPRIKADAA